MATSQSEIGSSGSDGGPGFRPVTVTLVSGSFSVAKSAGIGLLNSSTSRSSPRLPPSRGSCPNHSRSPRNPAQCSIVARLPLSSASASGLLMKRCALECPLPESVGAWYSLARI